MKALIIALQKAMELMKQDKKLELSIQRVEKASLDYQYLQTLVDSVANNNVEINLTMSDGTKMSIKPKKQNDIDYSSFKDRYEQYRKQI